VEATQIQNFYQVGVLGLRALEVRDAGRRRFGPDANARWQLFRGELGDGDRLDLLLRDAAVTYPAAFAPRTVFAIDGLAEDEPFGPDWPGPEPATVANLLGDPDIGDVGDIRRLLLNAASMWDLEPRLVPEADLAAIGPATRILAAGPGAVVSLAVFFSGRSGMDLADQVILLTDQPGERQLFGLANVLLETTNPVRILRCDASAEELRTAAGRRIDLVVLSAEADDNQRRSVETLRAELGA
jgi:hypothetical protein